VTFDGSNVTLETKIDDGRLMFEGIVILVAFMEGG
jgi:hypothetical protein